MNKNKKIHFEISERKILLKSFDVIFILSFLYIIGSIFEFRYFEISSTNFYWTILLAIYLNIFGSVFEMYNLQVASNQFQIIKSIILTTSTTVLFYLLTPIFTPQLPTNRLQIVLFYLTILFAFFVWRIFYLKFLATHRFLKRAIIVCDKEQLQELVNDIEEADPHYKIIGFVNSDGDDTISIKIKNIKNLKATDIEKFVTQHSISEIIIASHKTEGITTQLYNQLIQLLEKGAVIKEYTQLYEAITQRIPVHYVSRDFYRYFPFSRNNQNKLYLLGVRIFEIIASLVGLFMGLVFLPLVIIGNIIGNRGALIYTQERIGKNGDIFNIFKFRTMVKNAEANGAVFATSNDSRITPFGKFLRKSRLDEFPQFINGFKR